MEFVKLFLIMIFMHTIADFVLQNGFLAEAKQIFFWKLNAPDHMYRNDYIIVLFMHSFMWAFLIMLPFLIKYDVSYAYIIAFIINIVIHMGTDNLKANENKLNLVQDQLIHIFQILLTIVYYYII